MATSTMYGKTRSSIRCCGYKTLIHIQVIGSVGTMLQKIYTKPVYKPSQANVGSITFAGTVLGMLLFGN